MKTLKSLLTNFIAGVILIAGMGLIIWLSLHQLDKQWRDEDTAAVRNDTLATITRILQQDKKDCRLIDNWPDAPLVMLEAARKYEIDPYLLPAISRTEGPTPAMLKACNIYGLEYRGKLIVFADFYYNTEATAALLARHKWAYQSTGLVDVAVLAKIWCPLNAELWAENMKAIYTASIK
mgnify:CR=1 FL=1